jgi:hypothetical protein
MLTMIVLTTANNEGGIGFDFLYVRSRQIVSSRASVHPLSFSCTANRTSRAFLTVRWG